MLPLVDDAEKKTDQELLAMPRVQQSKLESESELVHDGFCFLADSEPTSQPQSGSLDSDSQSNSDHAPLKKSRAQRLMSFVPDTGYFLAGAAAGGVSRTATAPLDRLKVYLLVDTASSHGVVDVAGASVKSGGPFTMLRRSLAPIRYAVHDIHSHGGMRGFFTGQSNAIDVGKRKTVDADKLL